MKKTLIISVTAIAIVLSAGMSMAGPLRDHGQRSNAHDIRSAVSHPRTHAETKSKIDQTTKGSGAGSGLTSQTPIDEDCVDSCTDALS